MMALPSLLEFLNHMHARFILEVHSPAYTTQEVAERAHIRGMQMAKVVVLNIDGELALAVLPAHYHIACGPMAEELGAGQVRVAHEEEFKDRFPGCELGAIPPFSAMWQIPVYMSTDFHEDEEIAFNAGSWTEIVRMPGNELVKMAEPMMIEYGCQAPGLSPKRISSRPGRLAVHLH